MTVQEAKELCISSVLFDSDEHEEIVIDALTELEQYRVLGTVEELKEALEKQIPKKPRELFRMDGALKGGKCPTCERWINNGRYWMYCECGQALKWGEEDD